MLSRVVAERVAGTRRDRGAVVGGDFFVAVGNAQDEAVVGPHRFDFEAALGAQFGADGHAPRRVDASAERSQDADAAVAEFVAAGLDDDVLIVGDAAGGDGLIFEIAEQDFRRRWHRGCGS